MESPEKEAKDSVIGEDTKSVPMEDESGVVASTEETTDSIEKKAQVTKKEEPLVGVEESSVVVEEQCEEEDKPEDISISEITEENIDNGVTIDELVPPKPPSESTGSDPKPVASFRMQMGRDEIEKMIHEGTLEKVSEGYYKVKAESLKDLKVSGKPLPVHMADSKQVEMLDPPSRKGNPIVKESNTVTTGFPVAVSAVGTTVLQPQASKSSFLQQAPSFIAFMPVNQTTTGTPNNTLLALPYNPNMPAFVTLPPQNINTTNVPAETTTSPSIVATPTSAAISVETSSSAQASPPHESIITEPTTKTPLRSSLRTLHKKPTFSESPSVPSTNPVLQNSTGVKRKARFGNTKVRPYKYAKPICKTKNTSDKANDFVSDLNSSDEDELLDVKKKYRHNANMAAMFFKKIGDPKHQNRSLLDKLHKSIFQDSESEAESAESDVEGKVAEVQEGKSKFEVINCPGPGLFEAYVGPAQNSKLSIIRTPETKKVKNLSYEVYKVQVISAGREANTNIMIPVPQGYKFNSQGASKNKEELIEFSHTAHENHSAANYVDPKFLEKLALTQLKVRKYKDEIKVLRKRYLELLQEHANRPQFSTVSDLVGASAKFLTEDQLVFYLMQLKAGAHNMQGIRYSVREKVLALSIYQKSPEVYRWFRRMFNLPSKRVLDQWLEDVGSQDPQLLKRLMYHIYTTYNFKASA